MERLVSYCWGGSDESYDKLVEPMVSLDDLSSQQVNCLLDNLDISMCSLDDSLTISGRALSLVNDFKELDYFGLRLSQEDADYLISTIRIFKSHGVPKAMCTIYPEFSQGSSLTNSPLSTPLHALGESNRSPLCDVHDLVEALQQATEYLSDKSFTIFVLSSIPDIIMKNPKLQKELGTTRVVAENLMSILWHYMSSSSVTFLGLTAIRVMCRYGQDFTTSCEACIVSLSEAGACGWLVEALRVHNRVPEITEVGCWAMRNLCVSDDNRNKFGASGACELITFLLASYRTDRGVVEAANFTICNLCTTVDNSNRCVTAGCCAIVTSVLREHRHDSVIVESGAWAIRNLSNASSAHKRVCGENGTVDILCKLLVAHNANAKVCKNVCGALWNLCTGSDTNRRCAGEAGACEALAEVLRVHGNDAKVVELACGLLRLLSHKGDNKARLTAAGACDVLVRVLRLHGGVVGVAEHGLAVLNSLCTHTSDNRLRLGADGACELVVNALTAHGGVHDVVVQALNAVENLTAQKCVQNIKCFEALGTLSIVQSMETNPDIEERTRDRAAEVRILMVEGRHNGGAVRTHSASEKTRRVAFL